MRLDGAQPTWTGQLVLVVALLATSLPNLVTAKTKCSQKLTGRSGVIQTPNYPDNYPPNTDCYWDFVNPGDAECVVFTVEDFNIPNDENLLCPGDNFALESCGSWYDISPERLYCGDYTDVIESRGSFELVQHYQINATSLRVSFHSDSVKEGRGFLMQWRILDDCSDYGGVYFTRVGDDEVPCIPILDDVAGSFTSLNFPENYPPSTACAYSFKRPGPEYCGLFIRTSKFDLEERDGGRCWDSWGIPGCRKQCGTKKSPSIHFYEYQPGAAILPIQFESDFSTEGRGFSMSYFQVTDCFNPFQPECPNDQKKILDNECDTSVKSHDCGGNEECSDGKICCWDGCLRKCVTPSKDGRRKREIRQIYEFLDIEVDREWTEWAAWSRANAVPDHANTIPDFPGRQKKRVGTKVRASDILQKP